MAEPSEAFLAGQEAAKRLEPLSALESCNYGSFDPASRFQWIKGWQSEGGDISRRVVVTRLQRLQEREQQLTEELTEVREKIKELI